MKAAKPGTAIMVREGTYHENVKIPRTVSGEDDAPIWLISADGPQKAHVIARDKTDAAIGGGGIENFIVDGFWVTGGKNGIQFSANGFDFKDMIKNIVVENNVIDGFVEDGVKANAGEYVLVRNNVITGGKDEGIDFVAIVHGEISHNEVRGNTGTSAGIFAKGGSAHIEIRSNYVHDVTGDGISAGGWANFNRDMRPGYDKHMAQDVTIEGNRIADVGKRTLSFFGAADSVAKNNYLEALPDSYRPAVYVGKTNDTQYGVFHSSSVTIVDNFITTNSNHLIIDDGSKNVVFENNRSKVSVSDAGADIKGGGKSPSQPDQKDEPAKPEPDRPSKPEPDRPSKPDDDASHQSGQNSGTRKADILVGTEASERFLLQQGGNDSVKGNGGNDNFYLGGALNAQDRLDGGSGHDTVTLKGNYSGRNALSLGQDTMRNVEVLELLPGFSYDISTSQGTVAPGATLTVDAGKLRKGQNLDFDGSAETDRGAFVINAGNGNDRLVGGSGADSFHFGPGGFNQKDIVNGGGDNDRLVLEGNTSTTLGGNITNVETLVLSGGRSGKYNYKITSSNEAVSAGQRLSVDGTAVETGFRFDGARERDGSFELLGGNGGDVLTGGNRNDILAGGGGEDALSGGGGADRFVFDDVSDSTGLNFDRLIGFDRRADTIDLPHNSDLSGIVSKGRLSQGTFNDDLSAALDRMLDPGKAAVFSPTEGNMAGRVFLAVDADKDGAYRAGRDYVIEVVDPVVPLAPGVDFLV